MSSILKGLGSVVKEVGKKVKEVRSEIDSMLKESQTVGEAKEDIGIRKMLELGRCWSQGGCWNQEDDEAKGKWWNQEDIGVKVDRQEDIVQVASSKEDKNKQDIS